ncbi:hypothetical protein Pint_28753 [Pistacia integerrima]|uniref:Uncharacterized protein n=1 Tax=Pistacia integerrima TaxID=434235 RepID=A0ACC0YQU9_9ROSI|nr:hypothetical protein Pint_28753 [Pistacia integerrima]
MAEGTRQALMSDVVSILEEETVHLREEQNKQKLMLEAVLQQLSNMATSYDQLATHKNSQDGENGGEGSSNTKVLLGTQRSKPRIFLLEGLEEAIEEEAESSEGKLALIQSEEPTREGEELRELLGISLHAMAGLLAPKTMTIEGFINNQKVLILIDTRSTHSFMDPYIARRAKLPVGESHLTVKVANADSIPCTGVDWLRGLGSIVWNFSNLTMKFNFKGCEVQFQEYNL